METVAEAKEPVAQQEQAETPLESLSSICTVLAVGLFVMTFIFQNFEIPSGSMMNTLLIGDHVVVDRISFAPKTKWAPFVHYRDVRRGDVIVFYKPESARMEGEGDMFLVKRTMAVAGDRIHLEHGTVYINGVKQDEPYAAKVQDNPADPQDGYSPYRDDFPNGPNSDGNVTAVWAQDLPSHVVNGDLVVPPGRVFAMGDNRTHSLDGRFWGFVPVENIVGRPMFVYWSFDTPGDQIDKTSIGDRIGFMGHILIHIFDQTRWKRTFHIVR